MPTCVRRPRSGNNNKAFCVIRTSDNFNRGPVDFPQRAFKLFSGVAAVTKQACNGRVARTRQSDNGRRAVPILNIGRVHDGAQQISLCIGDDVALATFNLLARIKGKRLAATLLRLV